MKPSGSCAKAFVSTKAETLRNRFQRTSPISPSTVRKAHHLPCLKFDATSSAKPLPDGALKPIPREETNSNSPNNRPFWYVLEIQPSRNRSQRRYLKPMTNLPSVPREPKGMKWLNPNQRQCPFCSVANGKYMRWEFAEPAFASNQRR